jgi:hypothetical protein
VARGFVRSLGLPYTVETPNPQPGNPIVTFSSAALGAQAYAAGIRSFSRYAATRAAAARGDGLGYLKAITAAGWGTSYSCASSAYRSAGGVGAGPANVGSGSTTVSTSDQVYYKLLKQKFGAYIGRTYGAIINGGPYAPWDAIPETFRSFMAKLGRSEADVFTDADLQAIAGAYEAVPGNQPLDIPGAIARFPGELAAAAAPLMVNVGILGLAAVLVYSGLRDVLSGAS